MKIFILLLIALPALASAQLTTLNIGIDVSASNPLLSHQNFAFEAAKLAESRILALDIGDVVYIKTFGSVENPDNVINTRIDISRRMRPNKVTEAVTNYIRSIPNRDDVTQGSTNILAYLEFGSNFDCHNGGQILLITDGLEASSFVDPRAMLEGNAGLPVPEFSLEGCSMTFFGLGAGWQPQSIRHVRNEWRRWSELAGVSFHSITP